MVSLSPATIDLCSDRDLGYERCRTRFAPGEALLLDEAYRLAQLPLIAPDHPRVIPRREGASYEMGRHEQILSLVLPVPSGLLLGSEAFRALDAELRTAFAEKIAWDVQARRQDKLHATLCGSLAVADEPLPLTEDHRRELSRLGPIEVELRGLFSGNVNVGRLYLRAYPEQRSGGNLFQQVQRALGRRETDLYLVGLYHFTDDLNVGEAAILSDIIERWWSRPIMRFRAGHLWLLGARDDLVLDSAVIETIPLVAPHR